MSAPASLPTLLATAIFLVSSAIPTAGLFRSQTVGDVHLYKEYGEEMLAGNIPYRDFFVEYPPGALPALLLPALAPSGHYDSVFKAEMALCGVAAVFALVVALTAIEASRRRIYIALLAAAIAPLALGDILLNTYDLWPAALTVGALATLLCGRARLAFALLALGAAAKVYPLVLLPLAALYVWHRLGARALRSALLVFLVCGAALLLPFAVLGAGGLRYSFELQTTRGLEIESLGASLLLLLDRLGLYTIDVITGQLSSADLTGPVPDALATATLVLTVVAVAVVWLLVWRRPADGERLVLASAAAVAGVVSFGKVLSIQYLVWLIPLVPLVHGGAGILTTLFLLGALGLTGLLYGRGDDLSVVGDSIWLLLARNFLLVLLYVVLVVELARSVGRMRRHSTAEQSTVSLGRAPSATPPRMTS